jgi:hypothetical protein
VPFSFSGDAGRRLLWHLAVLVHGVCFRIVAALSMHEPAITPELVAKHNLTPDE